MDFSWLITGVLGIIVFYFVYWLVRIPNDFFEKYGIPIVNSPPVVGIMWEFMLMRKGLGEILNDVYKKSNGQKFVGYNQFLTPTIMIRDPELVNQILVKDFTHFEDRGNAVRGEKDLFSLGINMLTGDEWRSARHKLTPTFTSGKLKIMFEPIKECSDELVNYLERKSRDDFEARDLMLRYIINVIGNVAFGVKLDAFDESNKQSKEFFQKCSTFLKPSVLFFAKLMISMSNPKIKELFKIRLMDRDVETFFKGMTHDIIKQREKSNIRRNDFLQIMLDEQKKELNKELSSDTYYPEIESLDTEDKELIDQLKNTPMGSNGTSKSETFTEDFISSQTFLFITAGSETTATVLSFVLYELAANPDLQKKVQDEISQVLSSQELNYQAVRKLTYMEQFINETLRLHPIATLLVRVCTRDYKIPGTETIIPKGTMISIPAGAFHIDAQYFPEPKKFNPDRFKEMDAVPKGVFFTFGGGPRICIAMRLAMLEMKIILATLLSNYTLTLSEKTKLPLKMMIKSMFPRAEGGIWLKFKRR